MNEKSNQDAVLKSKPVKGRSWLWKIPLGVLLFLLVGLAVVLLNIDAIARIQINKALNRYLVAGGKLETVDVRLVKGSVVLSGLTINPPPECGPHPLMSMDHLEVDVDPLSLFSGEFLIEQIVLKGLSFNVVRDGNGRLSPMDLIPPAAPAPEPVEDYYEAKPPWIPRVHVNSAKVEDLSFRLVDRMLEQDWSANLKVNLEVRGLRLQDILNLDILVDHLDVVLSDMVVDQPPGFSREPLLAVNRIEMASSDIDLGASRVSISDVKLDTLSASLERNADREVNLLMLVDAWLPISEDGDVPEVDAGTSLPSGDPHASAFKLPTLVVDTLHLTSITAQVLDTIDGQPWRAGFEGLDVGIKGVEIGDIAQRAISLASFDLDLKGIAVDQVPGFGNRKLFSLDHFTVISEKPEKPSNVLVIKQVSLKGLTSFLAMRSDGLTNLGKLKDGLFGNNEAIRQDPVDSAVEAEASSSQAKMPPILFEQIVMEGGPVQYRDEAFADETLVASLNNIQVEVTQLRLFTDNADADPASASLFFELEQPGDLPTAYFGTLAAVGPVGYGVPMVNTQFRLVGLKLDTLGSLVPPATRTALGAAGLDVGAALAMDAESINLNASVLTDHNIRYEGITIQGSLAKPAVTVGPVMTGVFNRVSGGLVNIGKIGLKSGVDIAEGGVQAAKELGVGTVKVGENLGKSIFRATVGVVTLDKEKVKEGASGTTKGTVDLTKDSVKGTGEAAVGGLKSSASEMKGEERVKAWEQEIPIRYRNSMQHAGDVLVKMPYPPVTE